MQTVKKALIKAKEDGSDPDLTLLCLRTTPISSKIPSPSELITGRKPQGNLPTRHTRNPADHQVREDLQHRQDMQKAHHDTKAKDLPPLIPGQQVRFQQQPSSKWEEAVIQEKCREPRSYILETPAGRRLRRNRANIRSVPQSENHLGLPVPEDTDTPVADMIPTQVNYTAPPAANTPTASSPAAATPPGSPTVFTRSGRRINRPARFMD